MKNDRTGLTLIELLVAMVPTTILMVGLASTIYIGGRAFNDSGSASVQKDESAENLTDVMADLQYAQSFIERTATAATFTVPDRDGDSSPETIRYAWSGTPGDPLTYEYNGAAPVTLAADVQDFNLSYLTRFLQAEVLVPAEGGSRLLLVVIDPDSPTSQESARKSLIESWGYTVTMIAALDSQTNFDAAVADNDVAYISEEITASDLGTKLRNASIGVVNEEANLVDDFGLSQTHAWLSPTSYFDAIDNSHYITELFDTGPLTIFTTDESVAELSGTLSPDAKILGQIHGGSGQKAGLVVLEAGDELYGGGTAAGRRVELPWGANDMDINILNAAGRTIMQRSIAWAAGAGEDPPPKLLLIAIDPTNLTSQEAVRKAQIEAWGYIVNLIDQDDSQADFDAAVAANDVIYVPKEINRDRVKDKIPGYTIGIVNEHRRMHPALGLSSVDGQKVNSDRIDITNNSHYITTPFPTGWLTICSSNQELTRTPGDLGAAGFLAYADGTTEPAMSVFELGDGLEDGSMAPGRRIFLPWGEDNVDFNSLNADGLTIMQRAIEWAASPPPPPSHFGYETQFASVQDKLKNIQIATQVALPEDGTLKSITAYVHAADKKVRYAVYTDNSGEPGDLIVETDEQNFGKTTDWHAAIVTPTNLTAGTYWLALSFEDDQGGYYYESGGGQTRYVPKDAATNGFLPTWGTSSNSFARQISIYGTYTPSN